MEHIIQLIAKEVRSDQTIWAMHSQLALFPGTQGMQATGERRIMVGYGASPPPILTPSLIKEALVLSMAHGYLDEF